MTQAYERTAFVTNDETSHISSSFRFEEINPQK